MDLYMTFLYTFSPNIGIGNRPHQPAMSPFFCCRSDRSDPISCSLPSNTDAILTKTEAAADWWMHLCKYTDAEINGDNITSRAAVATLRGSSSESRCVWWARCEPPAAPSAAARSRWTCAGGRHVTYCTSCKHDAELSGCLHSHSVSYSLTLDTKVDCSVSGHLWSY